MESLQVAAYAPNEAQYKTKIKHYWFALEVLYLSLRQACYAMLCPVLTCGRMPVPVVYGAGVRAHELRAGCIGLRCCYAMSGTDLGHVATKAESDRQGLRTGAWCFE
eukprot:3660899-Rhodomonas_salina.1